METPLRLKEMIRTLLFDELEWIGHVSGYLASHSFKQTLSDPIFIRVHLSQVNYSEISL